MQPSKSATRPRRSLTAGVHPGQTPALRGRGNRGHQPDHVREANGQDRRGESVEAKPLDQGEERHERAEATRLRHDLPKRETLEPNREARLRRRGVALGTELARPDRVTRVLEHLAVAHTGRTGGLTRAATETQERFLLEELGVGQPTFR